MSTRDRFGFNLDDDNDSTSVIEPVVEQPEVEEVVEQEQDEEVEYEADDTTEYDEEADEPVVEAKTQKQSKKLYSPDEIKQLLKDKDFSGIDTSRLSEEGQAVMRAMQAGLTPKLQETAELKRELSEIRNLIKESAPKPQPKDIYEAYDANPSETMDFVNGRIKQMINDGVDIHEIEKVREVREQLRERRVLKMQEQAKGNSSTQESVNALLRAVPDVEAKQVELRDFAINFMGMTPEEVAYETSINERGMDAVKMIARINAAYEKVNAGKRAKAKVKAKTTKVEKPGSGFQKNQTTERDLFNKSRKTGQWRDYFLNMEE